MNARETALQIINEVEHQGAYANIALAKRLSGGKLTELDRRFVTELVYGTIKAKVTLDYFLQKFVSRPLKGVSPVILNILRLGVYQLVFLDKIPASAACNQSVELAKKYGHAGTVKFVNGVLRSITRQPEKLTYPDKEKQPEAYLSLAYFHPLWMMKRWLKRYGFAATEALCAANNEIPPLILRTNTLKITRDQLLAEVAATGAEAEAITIVPEGIVCRHHPALATFSPLQNGLCQVQDISSMLVAHVLDPQPGERILDACGAPGGKTTHIAALMKNQGNILAVDLYEHKLAIVRENAKRLGITIIETLEMDAVKLSTRKLPPADRVLVDAPCSGLGVLRHKPDSRWRKSPKILAELPELQLDILQSAAGCVKPGGVVVYSTCTIEPEENEMVIEKFLSQNPEFSLDCAGSYLPQPTSEKMIQFLPHRDGQDGFFIARLQRSR